MLREHDFWPALVLMQLDARAALAFSACCRRARELGVRTVACAAVAESRAWSGPSHQYTALKWWAAHPVLASYRGVLVCMP